MDHLQEQRQLADEQSPVRRLSQPPYQISCAYYVGQNRAIKKPSDLILIFDKLSVRPGART